MNKKNGKSLSLEVLLPLDTSVSGIKTSRVHLQLVESMKRVNPTNLCSSKISDNNLSMMILNRLMALISILSNDFTSAYRYVQSTYNSSLEYFSNREEDNTSWFIPVLLRVSNDFRLVAKMADMSTGDSENTLLRDSVQSLMRCWTLVAKDRGPVTHQASKKLALFALTNILFKIYFSLNTLSLCGKLINVIEGPSSGGVMGHLRLFPVSDVVMYKYYIGRLKMFEDKYDEARDCLRFALRYCPRSCHRNRQRILTSLVPVEMCLGVLPAAAVGTHYGLSQFVEIATAARIGDCRRFDSLLRLNHRSFVRLGVFLLIEQIKILVYRNLFKRIYLITGTTRLSLLSLEAGLRALDEDADLDEIECIAANLIFQGKMKGYLSHQKRYLVLSKQDPFPASALIKKHNTQL